jgi:membrane associated rhomboid family serine protease
MFENRGYAGERMTRPATPVTWILLALNAAVFVFQYYALPRLAPEYWVSERFEETFALSVEGLKAGHLWQLITYQFMHGSLLHILANSWAIYMFGQVVETSLGRGRMLLVYLLSGVAGGLLQILGMLVWPWLFGDSPLIGASAAAYGLIAAFVTLFPSQRLLLLLFFFIPISMRARTLLRLTIWFSLAGILYPFLQQDVHRYLLFPRLIDMLFVGIGHAAHLGGIAAGVLLTLWIRRGIRMRPVVEISPKSSLNITPSSE